MDYFNMFFVIIEALFTSISTFIPYILETLLGLKPVINKFNDISDILSWQGFIVVKLGLSTLAITISVWCIKHLYKINFQKSRKSKV